jgi:hypothetical protein
VQPNKATGEYTVAPGEGVDAIGRVETRGIDQIPDVERNSNPRNMAAAFASVQFSFVIIVFGGLPIIWGLGWWSTMTAVTVGVAIAADFSFYFPCRFAADEMDFEKFMAALYAAKKVAFISLK